MKSEEWDEINKRTTPQGMVYFAKDYLKAYLLVKEKEPDFRKFFHVRFFLLCHSIELSMKAYLKLKGYSAKNLIYDFGHDLEKLIDELYSKHEIIFGKEFVMAISMANRYYLSKQFEYFQSGSKELPTFDLLEDTAKLLIQKVEYQVHTSAKI